MGHSCMSLCALCICDDDMNLNCNQNCGLFIDNYHTIDFIATAEEGLEHNPNSTGYAHVSLIVVCSYI